MKIRLFIQTYQSGNLQRQSELDESLIANKSIEGLEVIAINKLERITFKEWFDIINQYANDEDISVLANSDIKFDTSILLANCMECDEVFALTRWDKGIMHNTGADAWLFRGKIREIKDCNFGLGVADCDYAIAERLTRAGYKLSNPSREIKGTHVHVSAHRTYYNLKKISTPHITHVPQLLLSDRKIQVNVWTCFSPSHEYLFSKFLRPSIPEGINHIVRQHPQLCKTGVYHTDGWMSQMEQKLKFMIEMAESGGYFVFLDADIKIRCSKAIHTMIQELGDNDIAFQRDHQNACTGCFVGRSNEKTIKLFKNALSVLEKYGCDQPAINSCLKNVRWHYLSKRYWNYSFFMTQEWDGKRHFVIPESTLLVHANWCQGIELKTRILELA